MQGQIITREEATRIREGPNGGLMGTHLASVLSARMFVINGFSLQLQPQPAVQQIPCAEKDSYSEVTQLQGGVPLPMSELHGLGGGHSQITATRQTLSSVQMTPRRPSVLNA